MKKLMVLSLVLAMAGISTANLVLEFDGVELSVVAPEPVPFAIQGYILAEGPMFSGGRLIFDTSLSSYLSKADLDAVFGADSVSMFSGHLDMPGLTDVIGFTFADAPTMLLPTGAAITEIGVTGVGYVTIYGADFQPMAPAVYIPEPMTMGLLGVGALFLRRRRK